MKITALHVNNFLTIEETVLGLDDRGLVLIQGQNLTDAGTDSNGAGKSSVVEALCWCLFGLTSRGLTGDHVVNRVHGKDCRVMVNIQDGEDEYHIYRYRNHSKHKNGLQLVVNGTDTTGGTSNITQESIERLIGCSYDVFSASIYAGQEAMPDLLTMTDKNLKSLIEEASGITRLQAALERSKEKLRVASAELKDAHSDVDNKHSQLTSAHEQLENYKVLSVEWVAQYKKDVEAKREKIEATEKELESYDVDGTELKEFTKNLDVIKEAQNKLADLSKQRSKWVENLSKVLNNIKSNNDKMELLKAQLKSYSSSYSELENSIKNGVCPTCGSDNASVEHMKQHQEKIEKQIEATKAEINKAEEQNSKLAEAHLKTEQKLNEIIAAIDTHPSETKLKEAAETVQAKINECMNNEKMKEKIQENLNTLIAELDEFNKKENPNQKFIMKKKDEIKILEKSYEAALNTLIEKEEAANVMTQVAAVFAPDGVRAHILDAITPFLNSRSNEYLSTLTDGNMLVEWSTIGLTAKGEVREKFNIAIFNSEGMEIPFVSLSGGEKRKVRLSTAMALQDLVASRATKPFEIFIADEVDHALDESGLERLMILLNKKVDDRGTVLVISHNDLKDWIRESVTVIKEGGISRVEGSLVL